MIATAHNSRRQCERCLKVKPFVLSCAFQGDGRAIFRHLCAGCERVERVENQPPLFIGMVIAATEPQAEADQEQPQAAAPQAQLDLFTFEEVEA